MPPLKATDSKVFLKKKKKKKKGRRRRRNKERRKETIPSFTVLDRLINLSEVEAKTTHTVFWMNKARRKGLE